MIRRAVGVQRRLRVPAAFRQRLGAEAHQVATAQQVGDERVQLEALERGVRIEQRVAVVEADDEAERDAALGHRVDEAATELLGAQRVAERVDDRARRQPAGRHVPQLLEPDRILRRLAAERQGAQQLLGEVAADAVGEDRHLGADVGPGLHRAARCAVLADAAIAGADAGHARALEQHLLAGEPHEQIDPGGLDLPGQPLDELAERDDVVAVIAERRRRDRQPELAAGRQVVDAVGADLAGQRRALGDEVGDQFGQRGRIEQGPGQGVGTGLPGLLHHGDRQRLAAVGRLQLGQTQRRRQAGRPGPDDQHVDVEGFSFHALAASSSGCRRAQPLPSSAMSAGAISNRSPWMP